MKYRNKKFTLAQQYASLAYGKRLNGKGKLTRFGFKFDFKARPTPLSREYSIRITMKKGKAPNVYILEPSLSQLAKGREIPHLYSKKKQEVCLYLPSAKEWNHGISIVTSIVPWTFLWLYFFEEWLHSDEWKGGGIHPDTSD